jgi:hypothetical protein
VASGGFTITQNGAVYENLDVNGTIHINADNVTLRNFRLSGGGHYGIQIESGHSGILIEDGEITGSFQSAGILGVGFTGRRLYIHGMNCDAMKVQGSGGPTLVEYSYVTDMSGSHLDGNHTRGGTNITFRYNNLDLVGQNATLYNELVITNMVIENNWLDGGTYTVYCPYALNGSTIYVRNNLFGRSYLYGTHAGNCAEWSNNRWEDTGGQIN